nr:exopolysaccharide biosynthesis protein [Microvirga roseola]
MDQLLPSDPRVRDLVAVFGERASGLLLAAIAIPAIIPVPGVPLGAVFGTVLVIVACRMVTAGEEFSLPEWLAQMRLKPSAVRMLAHQGPGILQKFEGRIKPRAGLLTTGPAKPMLALVMVLMGILIALPIPFGNILPGFAVILMGLGLAARDGLAILSALALAFLATGTSVALGWAAVWGLAHLLAS